MIIAALASTEVALVQTILHFLVFVVATKSNEEEKIEIIA
jgi:hypothetical protein